MKTTTVRSNPSSMHFLRLLLVVWLPVAAMLAPLPAVAQQAPADSVAKPAPKTDEQPTPSATTETDEDNSEDVGEDRSMSDEGWVSEALQEELAKNLLLSAAQLERAANEAAQTGVEQALEALEGSMPALVEELQQVQVALGEGLRNLPDEVEVVTDATACAETSAKVNVEENADPSGGQGDGQGDRGAGQEDERARERDRQNAERARQRAREDAERARQRAQEDAERARERAQEDSERQRDLLQERMREQQERAREMQQQQQEAARARQEAMRAAQEAARIAREATREAMENAWEDVRSPRTPSPLTPLGTPPVPPAAGCCDDEKTYNYNYNYRGRKPQGEGQTKKLVREYKVSAGEKLEIRNKYGSVNITTWPRNEIKVDITVRVNGYPESRIREVLDRIQIEEARGDGKISFVTIFAPNNSGYFDGRGTTNLSMEINYEVSMPTTTPLILANSYGNVVLGNFSAPLDVAVKYGYLKAQNISSENARVALGYSNGDVESMKSGNLELSFSKADIDQINSVTLVNKYSKLSSNKVGRMSIEAKYGDMRIDQVRELEGNAAYTGFNIGKLDKVLRLQAKYLSSFEVDEVSGNFEVIDLQSSFSTFNLHFAPNATFDFDTKFKYGDLRYPKELTKITTVVKEGYGNSATYAGTCGTGKPVGKLIVVSNYGDVRILRKE